MAGLDGGNERKRELMYSANAPETSLKKRDSADVRGANDSDADSQHCTSGVISPSPAKKTKTEHDSRHECVGHGDGASGTRAAHASGHVSGVAREALVEHRNGNECADTGAGELHRGVQKRDEANQCGDVNQRRDASAVKSHDDTMRNNDSSVASSLDAMKGGDDAVKSMISTENAGAEDDDDDDVFDDDMLQMLDDMEQQSGDERVYSYINRFV